MNVNPIAAELVGLIAAIPFNKIAQVLILILILDHGIRHLQERFHDWKGHWYCKLALTVLGLGLVCYAISVHGKIAH